MNSFVVPRLAIASLFLLVPQAFVAHASANAVENPIEVSIVNHASEDIRVDADVVWDEIQDYYLQGNGFAAIGYKVGPLAGDPAAFLGGYRITLFDKEGKISEQRETYITERDDKARRLSLVSRYLHENANGLIVHATYQAVPVDGGARYLLDVHSRMQLPEVGPHPDAKATAQQVSRIGSEWQAYLESRFRQIKKRLEEGHPPINN